jgi:hypothetical protein
MNNLWIYVSETSRIDEPLNVRRLFTSSSGIRLRPRSRGCATADFGQLPHICLPLLTLSSPSPPSSIMHSYSSTRICYQMIVRHFSNFLNESLSFLPKFSSFALVLRPDLQRDILDQLQFRFRSDETGSTAKTGSSNRSFPNFIAHTIGFPDQ